MLGTRTKFLLIAAVFALIAASTTAEARSRGGAVVGGLIAGAAIGAVVSGAIDHPRRVYVEEPRPVGWGESFSPAPGVRCYPAQAACYNNSGAYNASWTYNVYGR